MLTKAQLIESMGRLPENLTVDQIMEHILFIEKVQKGLSDSEEGRTMNKEEAKKRLQKWLK